MGNDILNLMHEHNLRAASTFFDNKCTHHRKTIEKNFKFKDGRIAKKSDENTEILKAHFSELFNSQVGIDIAVLEDIPKHEVQQKLGDMLTAAEIKKRAGIICDFYRLSESL